MLESCEVVTSSLSPSALVMEGQGRKGEEGGVKARNQSGKEAKLEELTRTDPLTSLSAVEHQFIQSDTMRRGRVLGVSQNSHGVHVSHSWSPDCNRTVTGDTWCIPSECDHPRFAWDASPSA